MIRIGIICPSEIAFRRFLPALQLSEDFQFVGVAVASTEEWFGDSVNEIDKGKVDSLLQSERAKAQQFIDSFGGNIFKSYSELVCSSEVDAVYIPLPPTLHFKWSKLALENGKHVFVEKPATTRLEDTEYLISLATEKKLALHENYMFVFHDQLKAIDDMISAGEIGDVRLYRISFGFPRRASTDFRFNKELGGGALLDAGGYTLKYASYLLGDSAKVVSANVKYIPDFDVEIFGAATVVNENGISAQVAFGLDNDYKCDIEIWGSKGSIFSNRILTAPAGFVPNYTIKINQNYNTIDLPADDAFLKSILHFNKCVNNNSIRLDNYSVIHQQAVLVSQFTKLTQ